MNCSNSCFVSLVVVFVSGGEGMTEETGSGVTTDGMTEETGSGVTKGGAGATTGGALGLLRPTTRRMNFAVRGNVRIFGIASN